MERVTESANGCEIVGYDELAKGSLAGLQKLLWSPNERLNAEHFEWKYERNPYASKPHVYAAMANGIAVGMRGFFGGRWEVGGPTPAPLAMGAGDLVIDPGYRWRRGLSARIMARALDDLAREDVPFVFNFSAGAVARIASLAAGWGSAGPLQLMQRGAATGAKQRLASLALRIARRTRVRSFERSLQRLFDLRSSSRAAKAEANLSPWQPFAHRDKEPRTKLGENKTARIVESGLARPREMADLVRRIGHDGRIRHVRDETYFTWRFGSPLSTYRFIYLERGEGRAEGDAAQLDAFLIMQATLYPMWGKHIQIVDWTGTTGAGLSAVLHAAVASAKRHHLDIWAGTLAEGSRAILRESGFVDYRVRSVGQYFPTVLACPTGRSSTSRPWLFGARDVLDLASWDLRLLDSDGT